MPFHRPLPTKVTEAFGVRRRYFKIRDGGVVKRWRGRHFGLDLDGDGGEPIGALTDGVVALTGHFLGPGKCVFLDHGQGFLSAYFHMREVGVKEGASIRRGEILGRVGATGNVSGPHLHLMTRLNGRLVDPAALLELAR
jgi:murein DD-endopeptidase MepM/ murein hydrolase activator NlpD